MTTTTLPPTYQPPRKPMAVRSRLADWAGLAGWIALCLAAGALGAIATSSSVREWYPGLVKPPGNPPAAVFGPVWTVLYVMMGVAAWRVWRRGAGGSGLRWFGVQLALNALWSLLFFGCRWPAGALVEIGLLWGAIAITAWKFRSIDAVAAALLLPYLAWVSFAAYLNAGIVWLN